MCIWHLGSSEDLMPGPERACLSGPWAVLLGLRGTQPLCMAETSTCTARLVDFPLSCLVFKTWKGLLEMFSLCRLIPLLYLTPVGVFTTTREKKTEKRDSLVSLGWKALGLQNTQAVFWSPVYFWGPRKWGNSNLVLNNCSGCGCQLEVLRGVVYKKPS